MILQLSQYTPIVRLESCIVTQYVQYTQLIIIHLKFFLVYWNTCTVRVFSASTSSILAYTSSNQIPILPMKHSLSIIFYLLLHIFCISHFPQNISSSLLASNRLSLFGLEVYLIHPDTPYLFQISSLANFFSHLSEL